MIIKTTLSIAAIAAFVAAAPFAFAKGHDQGQTAKPGDNVHAETVAAAKTLGNGGNSAGKRQDGNKPR